VNISAPTRITTNIKTICIDSIITLKQDRLSLPLSGNILEPHVHGQLLESAVKLNVQPSAADRNCACVVRAWPPPLTIIALNGLEPPGTYALG
jgi:hypothetical protein